MQTRRWTVWISAAHRMFAGHHQWGTFASNFMSKPIDVRKHAHLCWKSDGSDVSNLLYICFTILAVQAPFVKNGPKHLGLMRWLSPKHALVMNSQASCLESVSSMRLWCIRKQSSKFEECFKHAREVNTQGFPSQNVSSICLW